jgi:hypothetical protein
MSTEIESRLSFILASKDPSFSGLLEHLCHDSTLHLLTTTGPSITLETVRSHSPELVLIDLDSVEPTEASRLILKLALVSRAFVIITGMNSVAGNPSLDAFFQAGAHGTVVKPEGKTSLSLTGEPGKTYRKAILDTVARLRKRRAS